MRALRELVTLGFVEETLHGALSRKTRIASEWRLTAFKCDLTSNPKTCLFMQRGAQARDNRQSCSRARLAQKRASQEPEPGSNEGHEWLKREPVLAQKRASQPSEWLKREPVKPVFGGPPGSNDYPHIIYHVGSDPELASDDSPPPPADGPTRTPTPSPKASARRPPVAGQARLKGTQR